MNWARIAPIAYWALFTAAFLGVAIWESFQPRRELLVPAGRRWMNHYIVVIVCTAASMFVLRAAPVGLAVAVARSPYGLLNRAWQPFAVRFVLTILLLDLVRYAIHRLFHSVHFLWRIHAVHHSDPDFDVSTALRVHPLESVSIQGAYLAAIAILAAPPAAVLSVQLLGLFQNFFTHANKALPPSLEKLVRLVLFTPDIHRVHHSLDASEQDKNFGEIFPWWDRLFHTYADEPEAGREALETGLEGYRTSESLGVGFMLTLPFVRQVSAPTPLSRAASQE